MRQTLASLRGLDVIVAVVSDETGTYNVDDPPSSQPQRIHIHVSDARIQTQIRTAEQPDHPWPAKVAGEKSAIE
jgi:hypothetical protein